MNLQPHSPPTLPQPTLNPSPRPRPPHPPRTAHLPDPLVDLRHVEQYCAATAARCSDLERDVHRIQHDIEAKLSQWDTLLRTLSSTDSDARALTEQLSTQLHSLRANTTPQARTATDEAINSKERVEGSEAQLEKAERSIGQAKEALLHLERKLADEEATLRKIEGWQKALVWISFLSLALLILFAAWFFARDDFD
ncbi:hypothetical protein JCM10213_004787 [Rhodosporidiobolus nylandii]